MKRSFALVAALAALSISSAAAFADSSKIKPSSPLNSSTLLDFTHELAAIASGVVTASDAVAYRHGGQRTGYESVRYRPRRGSYQGRDDNYRGGSNSRGVGQIHAGFFDPDGAPQSGALFGFRGGQLIDDNVQLGVGVDWRHESANASAVSQEAPGPGGTIIVTRQDLARSSSNLFPVMGYLQAQGPSSMAVIPYIGVGGGYEVLFLSAEDFTTGEQFDGTFGGWGWQLWAGAAVPMSSRARITGEVFMNNAELNREVDDPTTGQTLRQSVDMDGLGLRLGLSWGF
jgi:hypothetical protein